MATALAVTPVFAQEGEKAGEKAAESSAEVWKWLNFAILAGVLGWLIAKNMGPVLVQRSAQIREGLAAGERAKAEAEAKAAAVQAKLAGLGQEVAQIQAEARADRDREATRITRETELEFERIQQQSAQEIESAAKLARLEVQRHAAKLAIELAEQKVRARMSPDTQSGLLHNFLASLGGRSAGQAG